MMKIRKFLILSVMLVVLNGCVVSGNLDDGTGDFGGLSNTEQSAVAANLLDWLATQIEKTETLDIGGRNYGERDFIARARVLGYRVGKSRGLLVRLNYYRLNEERDEIVGDLMVHGRFRLIRYYVIENSALLTKSTSLINLGGLE